LGAVVVSGVFLTLEGIEGSGKSTQMRLLSERLREKKLPLVVSKEPGGTSLGIRIRQVLLDRDPTVETCTPESELFLFYADRAQHLQEVIRPALAENKIVLVDRFEDSSRAYQGTLGASKSLLDQLAENILGSTRPHLTILLDIDSELSLQRVETRNLSLGREFKERRYDQETLRFHQEVRSRFLEIARAEPRRVFIVEAHHPPEQVFESIWDRVSETLKAHGHLVS
jgi:dTMP kinase